MTSAVHAQSYPSRVVTLLVPFPAGSATDGVARKMAEGLQDAQKQPVIVEHKPGGNGIIAARQAARAETDGYALFVATSTTHSANPNINTSLPYDPEKDFAPVTAITDVLSGAVDVMFPDPSSAAGAPSALAAMLLQTKVMNL